MVVDCVNTATGISYQDVFTSCQAVESSLNEGPASWDQLKENVEKLMVSISIPQLILHVRILNRALFEAGARLYLKVGTTGNRGMGLNIPYTHGEERPVAAPQQERHRLRADRHALPHGPHPRRPDHQGIRSPPRSSDIAAWTSARRWASSFTAWRKADAWPTSRRKGRSRTFCITRGASTWGRRSTSPPIPTGYEPLALPDGSSEFRVPLVDTGENGVFTRGEFEAITRSTRWSTSPPKRSP